MSLENTLYRWYSPVRGLMNSWALIGQTDWGQGIYARSRALLSDGKDAERRYRDAVDRLNRTGLRPELADGAPALRRVAAPRAPTGRGRGAAAHRARHVRRDRHASVH